MNDCASDGTCNPTVVFVVVNDQAMRWLHLRHMKHSLECSAIWLEDSVVASHEDVVERREPLDVGAPLAIKLITQQRDLRATGSEFVDHPGEL